MITIFLDLDGVISRIKESLSSTKDFWERDSLANKMRIQHPFNQKCVKVLNEILKEFDCQIILTSDWRINRTIDDLDIIFKHFKVIQSPDGVTERLRNEMNLESCRALEIIHFIGENQIKDFIILDDLDLEMFFPPKVLDKFLKTDANFGIAEVGFKDKIIEKLKLF